MKKSLFAMLLALFVSPLFAKTYSEYLVEAKKYESQKRWCYALGSYYDAMGTDELPEKKVEAYERYTALADTIKAGNPGFGKFDKFTIYDEWKKLLIDAEKYGSSICVYDIVVGNLEEESLDYKTKTATYSAKIDYTLGDRYYKTIGVVEQGLKAARRNDWDGIPYGWPIISISPSTVNKLKGYNINGVLIIEPMHGWLSPDLEVIPMPQDIEGYLNSFMGAYSNTLDGYLTSFSGCEPHPYICKFNIVDEQGKELVKGKEIELDAYNGRVSFSGINSKIINLINNGKAFLNLEACYLQGGVIIYDRGGYFYNPKYHSNATADDYCIKNIDKEKVSCISWLTYIDKMMVNIDDKAIKMLSTEVTQDLYEKIMKTNPSHFKGDKNLPVECVSWFDSICFCNKLSEIVGLMPVYTVNGSTNPSDWNYTPHQGKSISSTITENESANGFRLPSHEEWSFADSGEYPGAEDFNDFAWCKENSGGQTHPVAQKMPNIFGLYDMKGNILEMISFNWNELGIFATKEFGGSYIDESYKVTGYTWKTDASKSFWNIGFRIVRNNEEIIQKTEQSLLSDFVNRTSLAFYDDESLDYGKIDYIEILGNKAYLKRLYALTNQISMQKGFTPCYYQKIDGKKIYDISKWNLSNPVYYDETSIGFFINGDSVNNLKLLRKATAEEKAPFEKSKMEAIKSYFEKISVNSQIVENVDNLICRIPLDNYYTENSIFILKDSSGKEWKITQGEFLSKLNEITNQDFTINTFALIRKITDKERADFEKSKKEVVKNYFDNILLKGNFVEMSDGVIFSIPLDNSYNISGSLSLKDSSGKTWDITQADFLSKLKEITNQDYTISYSSLIRRATNKERNDYDKSKTEVVKSYFNKIALNGSVKEYNDTLTFNIPLDESYNQSTSSFVLKDSSGKSWTISKDDFLARIRESTGQNYTISSSELIRTPTENEKAEYEKEKEKAIQEAVKSYFGKINVDGKVSRRFIYDYRTGETTDSIVYRINLDNSFNEYTSTFLLDGSAGRQFKLSQSDFLSRLKVVAGQEYKLHNSIQMSEQYLYRDATKKEKESYAFENGKLHTNIVCKVKDSWMRILETAEVEGGFAVTVKSFRVKKSVFEKSGIKTKDVIKRIVLVDESGSTLEIGVSYLWTSIPAPSKLIFTVERGKGKKAQTLTIEIPVEWNEDELKQL